MTPTAKVLKRVLRRERWETSDPVWWQPARREPYRRLTDDDVDALTREFEARGRGSALAAM
jgi:fatty-acyl-CoA synthase